MGPLELKQILTCSRRIRAALPIVVAGLNFFAEEAGSIGLLLVAGSTVLTSIARVVIITGTHPCNRHTSKPTACSYIAKLTRRSFVTDGTGALSRAAYALARRRARG